jgi:excinuclease ABC subunit A
VKFAGVGITDIAQLSVHDVRAWVQTLQIEGAMSAREADIARDLLPEIRSRLEFLEEVGLGYLTLDRAAPTLSGGEAQRIRLAAQLGSNLQGVCYVLDEPTIGLHARDNQHPAERAAQAGRQGQHAGGGGARRGHHPPRRPHHRHRPRRRQARRAAGGARRRGRHRGAADSVTGRYLLHAMKHPLQPSRAPADQRRRAALKVKGARLHNLQQGRRMVPLKRLVAVTGVSGSGKIHAGARRAAGQCAGAVGSKAAPRAQWTMGCDGVEGSAAIDRVLEVDQTPIGKTPRSCPATYIGFWDTIRKLFADTLEAGARLRAGPLQLQHRRGPLPRLRRARACAPSR